MILGIGVDLLNIERIKKLFLKFGEKLENKILSEIEIKDCKKSKNNKINFIAKKFCAKESFSKALGIGIGRGINFKDITITNDILGKPIVVLSDSAIVFLEQYYKESFEYIQIDLSISDEEPFVNSFVVVSLNKIHQ